MPWSGAHRFEDGDPVDAGTRIGVALTGHGTKRVSTRDLGLRQIVKARPQMYEVRPSGLLAVTVAPQDAHETCLGVQHRDLAVFALGHVVEPPQDLVRELRVCGIEMQVELAGPLYRRFRYRPCGTAIPTH
jgi:hypothetical protein